jgi:hypothetical protein
MPEKKVRRLLSLYPEFRMRTSHIILQPPPGSKTKQHWLPCMSPNTTTPPSPNMDTNFSIAITSYPQLVSPQFSECAELNQLCADVSAIRRSCFSQVRQPTRPPKLPHQRVEERVCLCCRCSREPGMGKPKTFRTLETRSIGISIRCGGSCSRL